MTHSQTSPSHHDWFTDHANLEAEIRGSGPHLWRPAVDGLALHARIGEGGQGAVYEATVLSSGNRIAVKFIRPHHLGSNRQHQRFERELDVVSRLNHPNIIRPIGSGVADSGHPYILMELVEGESLQRILNEHSPSGRKREPHLGRLDWFEQLCDAIWHAHLNGVIHRDLKPSNIMIDVDDRVRVLDFGLARHIASSVGQEHRHSITQTGQFIGSFAWAAPEALADRGMEVDARSDVYSLGLILYATVTGSSLTRADPSSRPHHDPITDGEFMFPERWRTLPRDLRAIVRRCLRRDPNQRYQSVDQLLADIRRFRAGQPVAARRENRWYDLKATIHTHRVFVAASLMLMLACVIFGNAMWLLHRRALDAEKLAQTRLLSERDEAQRAQQLARYLLTIFDRAPADGVTPSAHSMTVIDLLSNAARRAESDLIDQPGLQAEVNSALARWLITFGAHDDGLDRLRAALDVRSGLVGELHPANLSDVALAFKTARTLDRPNDTLEYAQWGVDLRWAACGPRVDWMPSCLTLLAEAILDAGGDPARAETVAREAVDALAPLSDEAGTAQERARANTTLGLALVAQAKYAEAIPLLALHVPSVEEEFGPGFEYSIRVRQALSLAYKKQVKEPAPIPVSATTRQGS